MKGKEDEKERAPYLTKRLTVSAAKRGVHAAAKETMEVMGYNVEAQNGNIVKKYPDGRVEIIGTIAEVNEKLKKINKIKNK